MIRGSVCECGSTRGASHPHPLPVSIRFPGVCPLVPREYPENPSMRGGAAAPIQPILTLAESPRYHKRSLLIKKTAVPYERRERSARIPSGPVRPKPPERSSSLVRSVPALLSPTHTLHYIYPAHDDAFCTNGSKRREPAACYVMRVSDSSADRKIVVGGDVYNLPELTKNHSNGNGAPLSLTSSPLSSRRSSIVEALKSPDWEGLSGATKAWFVVFLILRLLAVVLVIFVYICTLANLATAFTLLSSRGLGTKIRDSWLIKDPASALIVGMLVTVVLQSSTTFTNVLVSMVAANSVIAIAVITVHMAIPMMIGSELGTSFVNGIIALTYVGDRASFKRAFSAAIVGDVFNICCILVCLPLELLTGFIERLSWFIVDPLVDQQGLQFRTLELLTDPINRFIIEVDEPGLRNATISDSHFPADHSFIMKCSFPNGSRIYNCPYKHIFANTTWSDDTVAKVIIVCSVLVLAGCLFCIVFLINNIMKGRVKESIHRLIERDCPGRFKPCTGYTILLCGLVLTLLVQSNSVFSSSLTPLAGAGVITLEKLYALTLGSNMGTTFSGVLAAMAADPSRFEMSLHMAMCQVIYNVYGTLLYYPIPALRRIPLRLAGVIGDTTSRYRWFVVAYLVILFVLVPITVIGLSLLPPVVTVFCFAILYLLLIYVIIINVLQARKPQWLPVGMRTWHWLPHWLRSLEPYDKKIMYYAGKVACIRKLPCMKQREEPSAKPIDHSEFLKISAQTQV